MVVGTTLRHAAYSAATVPFPALLRRAYSNPYLVFVLILVADYAVLTFALTALAFPKPLHDIRLSDLGNTAIHLWHGWEAPMALFKEQRLSGLEILLALPPVFLDLALLEIIRNFGEFRRKDEDYIWLAQKENRLARFSTALRHLSNVKSQSTEARLAEIVSLIGVNQIAEAEKLARAFLETQHNPNTPERVLNVMMGAITAEPVSMGSRLALVKWAIGAGVMESSLVGSFYFFNWGDYFDELMDTITAAEDRYPIANAIIAFQNNKVDEALALLEKPSIQKPSDKIYALSSRLEVRVKNPAATPAQQLKIFRDFMANDLPQITKLFELCTEELERLAAVSSILALIPMARGLDPDVVEQLSYVADRFKGTIKDEDLLVAIRALDLTARSNA
jgi:hypothetical protein